MRFVWEKVKLRMTLRFTCTTPRRPARVEEVKPPRFADFESRWRWFVISKFRQLYLGRTEHWDRRTSGISRSERTDIRLLDHAQNIGRPVHRLISAEEWTSDNCIISNLNVCHCPSISITDKEKGPCSVAHCDICVSFHCQSYYLSKWEHQYASGYFSRHIYYTDTFFGEKC
jgi:hypothetical protein